MQDASAKYPRLGLMEGRAQFPGNFQSCLEIKTGDERIGVGKHCMMLGEPFDPTSEAKITPEVLKRRIEGDTNVDILATCIDNFRALWPRQSGSDCKRSADNL